MYYTLMYNTSHPVRVGSFFLYQTDLNRYEDGDGAWIRCVIIYASHIGFLLYESDPEALQDCSTVEIAHCWQTVGCFAVLCNGCEATNTTALGTPLHFQQTLANRDNVPTGAREIREIAEMVPGMIVCLKELHKLRYQPA